MRVARFRNDSRRTYLHLFNRVAGEPGYFPFGDVEKEFFFNLVKKLSRFYTIEVISCVCMSNHWHCVVATPDDMPDDVTVMHNFEAYYGDSRLTSLWTPSLIEKYGARMRDFSCFVKDLQQQFTCWFNRTRTKRRRGSLWADRFKSVILEDSTALWHCVKYVELNPVRAKLVSDPADYRFSTWGRLCGSGTHPFRKAFVEHLRKFFGKDAEKWSQKEVISQLRANMAHTIANDNGEDYDTLRETYEEAKRGVPFSLTVKRRVRYWTDGAVIGSKTFVLEMTSQFTDPERALKRRPTGVDNGELFAMRKLRLSY